MQNIHIQSRSEDHINIYIDLYEYAPDPAKRKADRSALICKTTSSIYLGGTVLFKNDGLNFEHVRKSDFREQGVDFKIFESLVKKYIDTLMNNKNK